MTAIDQEIEAVAQALVRLLQTFMRRPEAVRIQTSFPAEEAVEFLIIVAPEDRKLIIGHEGANIGALRTICRFIGFRKGFRFTVRVEGDVAEK